MRELKITVDTNLLVYLFDPSAKDEHVKLSCSLIKAILDNCKYVPMDVQISTSFEDDLLQDDVTLVRSKAILLRVRNIFQQVSPGIMVSREGRAVPNDEDDSNLFQELQRILFPNLDESGNAYINKVNDIKHLFSHIKNGREIYITNDSNFLKESKRIALKIFHIQVMSIEEFISYLASYLGKDAYEYKEAPIRHDYQNPDLIGFGEMDFTNNNGLYLIGSGDFLFEIKWGECSHEKMRVYNDPRTIEAIALAEDKKFQEVVGDSFYDFTDRCREPRRKKDILILKNSKGYFAAVRILDFKVKDRGDDRNYLKFKYRINTKGTCNFKEES
jgi:hypothetical protein